MNKKAVRVGLEKALIILKIPKIKPTNAPTTGPSKIAPIITGMCIIVALIKGSWINPSGVIPKIMEIADSMPTIASCLVLSLALRVVDTLLCIIKSSHSYSPRDIIRV